MNFDTNDSLSTSHLLPDVRYIPQYVLTGSMRHHESQLRFSAICQDISLQCWRLGFGIHWPRVRLFFSHRVWCQDIGSDIPWSTRWFLLKSLSKVSLFKLAARNGGQGKPEMRIPALIFGSFFTPIGLLWVGCFKWIVHRLTGSQLVRLVSSGENSLDHAYHRNHDLRLCADDYLVSDSSVEWTF